MFSKKSNTILFYQQLNEKKDLPSIAGQPDALSNQHLHQIGFDYLAIHPKQNMRHKGQAIANELINYNKNSHVVEKWEFLSSIHAKLHNDSNQLKNNIRKLFADAFQVTVTNEIFINGEMIEFNNHYTTEFCLLQMVNKYYTKKFYEEMIFLQQQLVLSSVPAIAFASNKEEIDLPPFANNPNGLSNQHIRQIGQLYLEKHAKKTFRHKGQDIANQLFNYSDNSYPMKKWEFLCEIHAKLHDSSNLLKNGIRSLFINAFNVSIIEEIYDGRYRLILCNREISDMFLSPAIYKYYVKKLQEEVNSLKHMLSILPLPSAPPLEMETEGQDAQVEQRLTM